MLSEKEKNIMKALVEDEIEHVVNHGDGGSALLNGYRRTLDSILLKLRVDSSDIFDREYAQSIS